MKKPLIFLTLLIVMFLVMLPLCRLEAATLTLHFTAPADYLDTTYADTVKVDHYEIRMIAGSDSVSYNWENGTVVPNNIIPQEPGMTETFKVTNLTIGEIYCFMVRAYDAAGNISDLGNVVCYIPMDIIPPDPVAIIDITQP